MSNDNSFLQFVPLSSFVQPSFWNKFTDLKINIDKLSETERNIYGFFSNNPTTWTSHILEVDSTSFNSTFNVQNSNIPFHGKLFNKNTVEQFKDCDKTKLINEEGCRFLAELKSGNVLETPSRINFFFILSFSDLKKYHFYYWFAFPVPHNLQIKLDKINQITDHFTQSQIDDLNQNYLSLDPHQKAYFLIHENEVFTLKNKLNDINPDNYTEYYFAFADFVNDTKHPSAQLKNFVIFLLHHCPFLAGKTVSFLSFFQNRKLSCGESLIYKLVLPETYPDSWTGWEKNEKGRFGPRFSNMKATMDPKVLFEESVDLNLKLMKWRLLPDIDLDKIKDLKVLLLGSGTLGCSVARNLLGWGVRNVTFVDNSTVSYSNPVRQHLFTYEDAINNRPKALAAAEQLKKIFPTINVDAHQLTIPMPGHNVGESTLETVRKSVTDLEKLISENDIIFLLTDSRESRWLPTLLGIHFQKVVMNVALGFDSYLVMRYGRNGGNTDFGSGSIPGNGLGCYFCNDVTAPGDSMKDRTLDQQCTVTRPGVSSVAGALAVELAISITQHEEGINAPAFLQKTEATSHEGILGILPHSIRGFLSNFSHVLPATPKYKQCIACSEIVLQEYASNHFAFLLEVFNSSKHLENLTGLTELLNQANFIEVLEISDDEWQS